MPYWLRPGQCTFDEVVLLVHQHVSLFKQDHVLVDFALIVCIGAVDHFIESLDQIFFEHAIVNDHSLIQVVEYMGKACQLARQSPAEGLTRRAEDVFADDISFEELIFVESEVV